MRSDCSSAAHVKSVTPVSEPAKSFSEIRIMLKYGNFLRSSLSGRATSRTRRALFVPNSAQPVWRHLWPWGVLSAAGASLSILLVWTAGEWAGAHAREEVTRRAGTAALLHATVLRSELEKHRSLPFVLAEDSELRQALLDAHPAELTRLNTKLEGLSRRTRAAVIYLLNDDGVAIAASNWRLPTSFVGTDYGFRPYFQNAMRDGVAEYFALGAVSGRPGLFLARRVENGSGALGVIVVKVEFEALEREWSQSGEPAFVVNADGVVLVTNVPQWRFGVAGPLPPERRRRLAHALQMAPAALTSLPIAGVPTDREIRVTLPEGGSPRRYIEAVTRTASPGWTLHLLEATDPFVPNSVTTARTVTASACLLMLLGTGSLLYRRRRAAEREVARESARVELEARVEDRTIELRASNQRLVVEMDERRRAEANLHLLRDELVQASKLAVLGQVAAGVAHEINQPVAAIRSYAENTRVLMARGEVAVVERNLDQIVDMTSRVGAITDELRAFSRKSTGAPSSIPLSGPVDGALLLLAPRARRQGVTWVRAGSYENLRVLADRARLEQVLVNLLQNALEAVEGLSEPSVALRIETGDEIVRLTVADNGSGAPEAVRGQLFTPFVTTKPNGLGLGLVISRDIITAFGGDLVLAESAPDTGAAFTVSLRRAS